MNDPLTYILSALRTRITRTFPSQIRECLAVLNEEQIWWRPNEASNSIGNLVIHLTGSLNHYLNFRIGGLEYHRDRPAEFAERRHLPKAELLAMFDDMIANAEKTFDSLTLERLGDPSPEQKMYTVLAEDLIAVMSHIASHAGQILYITKFMNDGGLDELWIKTHKQTRAWK